jgi:hypothetical protein
LCRRHDQRIPPGNRIPVLDFPGRGQDAVAAGERIPRQKRTNRLTGGPGFESVRPVFPASNR